jgi:tetratricopeptide (TPR) repeat protein
MVREDSHRTLLFDLDMAINKVNQTVPNHPVSVALTCCYPQPASHVGGRVSAMVTHRPSALARPCAAPWPPWPSPGSCRGVAAAQSMWDDPAFVLYRQGLDAMDAKDFAKAAALARDATSAYPEHVLAFYLLGQASLAQSRWEDAAQALAQVTALYPGAASARRDLGAAYQQLGRIDDAARALEAALATRPEGRRRARCAWRSCSSMPISRRGPCPT